MAQGKVPSPNLLFFCFNFYLNLLRISHFFVIGFHITLENFLRDFYDTKFSFFKLQNFLISGSFVSFCRVSERK